MINDEEGLLRSVQEYVKDNLNTKITSLNTEKGDFLISLIPQDSKHYVFAGELLDLPNDIFVQFAIEPEIEIRTNGNDLASIVGLMVEVAFDNPKTANTYFKSLRYMRALYEVLAQYGTLVQEADGYQITKATPMLVTLQGRQLVVSGVGVLVGIG